MRHFFVGLFEIEDSNRNRCGGTLLILRAGNSLIGHERIVDRLGKLFNSVEADTPQLGYILRINSLSVGKPLSPRFRYSTWITVVRDRRSDGIYGVHQRLCQLNLIVIVYEGLLDNPKISIRVLLDRANALEFRAYRRQTVVQGD